MDQEKPAGLEVGGELANHVARGRDVFEDVEVDEHVETVVRNGAGFVKDRHCDAGLGKDSLSEAA